eukprot:1159054-Pelagomonas_calceolata.AAC.6
MVHHFRHFIVYHAIHEYLVSKQWSHDSRATLYQIYKSCVALQIPPLRTNVAKARISPHSSPLGKHHSRLASTLLGHFSQQDFQSSEGTYQCTISSSLEQPTRSSLRPWKMSSGELTCTGGMRVCARVCMCVCVRACVGRWGERGGIWGKRGEGGGPTV